jgi:predicted Zn-dependent protease
LERYKETTDMKLPQRSGWRAGAKLVPLLLLAACAVNPATGERQLIFTGLDNDVAMGREADGQVSAAYGLVEDEDVQRYVSDIGLRIAARTEAPYPDLPWSFKVVDDPVVNAFALPGGFIYVTRGILARFDSEAELAGVLGHEIGHVTARHSASQMSRQQLMQGALGVGMILSETVARYGQLGMLGVQLLSLQYSRDDESQSDRLGLRYMTREGYDPQAMIGVFRMLAQVSGGAGERLPEWQLTHPYPENREQQIRDILAQEQLPTGGTVDRDEYLGMLDGLVYGPNPREGYFEGTRFLHPEMAFELTFPTGWTTLNQRSLVAAASPQEDGVVVMQVPEGEEAPGAAVRSFLAQEGISGGEVREDTAEGIERARATFRATTQDGNLAGEVAYVAMGGTTFQILGYAAASSWSGYAAAVAATIDSFARVTDQAVLGVQPLRLEIVTLPEAMSFSTFHQRNDVAVSVEQLAELNRSSPASVLSAGTRIKTVVGTPVG